MPASLGLLGTTRLVPALGVPAGSAFGRATQRLLDRGLVAVGV